ncbi:MAG TPA: CerR family C-terminal domain-containing protein [Burkholderiales bacterium]|jgi:AcrR family transcriptional regulator
MTSSRPKSSARKTAGGAERNARTDGAATRARIIEAAGQLFAEHGYADTTSKAVCERAQTNIAAVNYHFGSRDGLYLALLEEVHQRLMSIDYLTGLADSALPAEEKLGQFIDGLAPIVINGQSWHTRLWARELFAPSPLLPQVMREQTMPKFNILLRIISEITGIPARDPALTRCMLNIMAPCIMLLIIRRNVESPIQGLFKQPAEELAQHMKAYALGGLAAIATERRKAA